MKRYVFIDCETAGLPRNYKAPPSDLHNWPRVIQLAWIVTDEEGAELEAQCHLIQPEGFRIPKDAVRIHGITTEKATEEGRPIGEALDLLAAPLAPRGTTLVAHNLNFDFGCIGAEFIRYSDANPLAGLPNLCTMKKTTDICRLPGTYGFKWPSLEELHQYLFGEGLEDAHDALADVKTCAKCFFELKKKNLI